MLLEELEEELLEDDEEDDDEELEDDDEEEDELDDEELELAVPHFLSFDSLGLTHVSFSSSKTLPSSHSNLTFSYPLAYFSFLTHL